MSGKPQQPVSLFRRNLRQKQLTISLYRKNSSRVWCWYFNRSSRQHIILVKLLSSENNITAAVVVVVVVCLWYSTVGWLRHESHRRRYRTNPHSRVYIYIWAGGFDCYLVSVAVEAAKWTTLVYSCLVDQLLSSVLNENKRRAERSIWIIAVLLVFLFDITERSVVGISFAQRRSTLFAHENWLFHGIVGENAQRIRMRWAEQEPRHLAYAHRRIRRPTFPRPHRLRFLRPRMERTILAAHRTSRPLLRHHYSHHGSGRDNNNLWTSTCHWFDFLIDFPWRHPYPSLWIMKFSVASLTRAVCPW